MRWRPLTCECELEIVDNEYWTNPGPANCHILKLCGTHLALALEDVPAAVRWDNMLPSAARVAATKAVIPDIMTNFRYSYDDDRNIEVSFETISLTSQQKAMAELFLNNSLDGADLDDFKKGRIQTAFGVNFESKPKNKAKVQTECDKSIGKNRVKVV